MTSVQPSFYRRLPPWAYVVIFSVGHFTVDFYAALVTPLLEEFRGAYGIMRWEILAYTAPATIFGSLLQPVLGLASDRWNRGTCAGLAVLTSGIFLSLSGVAPHPIFLTLALTLGGIGVGLFHPATAAAVAQMVPGRSNFLMSIFVVSGMTGLAAAGVVVTRFVKVGDSVDLGRTIFLMPLGLAVAVLVLGFTPFAPKVRAEDRPHPPEELRTIFMDFFSKEFHPIRVLCVIACLRAFSIIAFQSFVPFLAADRHWSLEENGMTLSALLFMLGIGGLLGGYLSDRMNPKSLLAISTLVPIPALIVFAFWENKACILFFGLAGLFIGLATPLTVVFAQQLQPRKAGLVSGLMMGFAWGISGIFMPLVGWVAEHFGMPLTLAGVAFLLAPAAALVWALPDKGPKNDSVEIRNP